MDKIFKREGGGWLGVLSSIRLSLEKAVATLGD